MPNKFFLCGDSHSSILALWARRVGIAFDGAPIGNGLTLEQPFFRVEDGKLILTGKDLAPRQRFFTDLLSYDGPILSTVGFNSHRFAQIFSQFLIEQKADLAEISDAVFETCVLESRRGSLQFYETLVAHGRQIYFTSSPQLCRHVEQTPVLQRFEKVYIAALIARGARFVDVRPQIMVDGHVEDRFISKTGKLWIHGSDDWTKLVYDEFVRLQGVA